MSSIPNSFPISLKSWPSNTKTAIDLPTFFQRVNYERGGLTKLNEASLREEIQQEEAAKSEGVENEQDDVEMKDAEEEKGKAATREELLAMLGSANQSAMFALEFVSLLISKDMPVQGSETMSQQLRDRVGMGTLGAAKSAASWAKPELAENNKIIARGRKTQDVNRAVDSILASATRLEKEIELETKYWSQVLALNDQGWNVCRVPRKKGVLGVKFGSSEITPVLQNQGLVALQRTDLGVEIQGNPLTAEPKALRVRIQVNGEDTGCSKIPAPILPMNTSAHAVLLQARNTLFALELWHEINKESRNLGSFGIQAKGETLHFPITTDQTAVFDLVSINDYTPPSPQSNDSTAQGFSLALDLMLSYAHRQTHRRRAHAQKAITNPKRITHVQPTANKTPNIFDSPAILRSIITLRNHQNSVTSLTNLFESLTTILRKASHMPEPTYTTSHLTPPLPPTISPPERVLACLTTHLSTNFTLHISETTTLHVNVRTSMGLLPTSIFTVGITPENSHPFCPPPQGLLASFTHAEEFILFWAASVVAYSFQVKPPPQDQAQEGNDNEDQEIVEGWYPTSSPVTLRYDTQKGLYSSRLLTFTFLRMPLFRHIFAQAPAHSPPAKVYKDNKMKRNGLTLRLIWEVQDGNGAGVDGNRRSETANMGKEGWKKGEGVYEWDSWKENGYGGVGFEEEEKEEEEDEVLRSLGDVVKFVGDNAARADVR